MVLKVGENNSIMTVLKDNGNNFDQLANWIQNGHESETRQF